MGWFSELPDEGVLAVLGDDARDFLQGQLSCDLGELLPGHSIPGAWLNPRGRVFAVSRVLHADNGIALILPRLAVSDFGDALRRFVLRARVELEDRSGEIAVLGTTGIGQKSITGIIAGLDDPETRLASFGDRSLLVCPRARLDEVRARLADSAEARPASDWMLADIRDGFPRIAAEGRERFTAQMLNLDLFGGVSFAKGCYPGQEIVARAHHLGSAKRRMLRFWLPGDAAPAAGEPVLLRDAPIGRVVSAEKCPEGGCEALAVVQLADAAIGSPIATQAGAPLERLVLPYLIPEPEAD